jgi:hypothetical protein
MAGGPFGLVAGRWSKECHEYEITDLDDREKE